MIRNATTNDIGLIRALAHAIWPVSYRDMISPAQIDYMLGMMYSEESLLRQMNEEGCVFLIAETEGGEVGFASYSKVTQSGYKLHKLYVLPSEQGKGTGKKLVNEILERLKLDGGKTIELQVNKNNKAVHFYSGMGFSKARELVLDIGGGYVMDDYIMVKELD